MKKSVVIVFLLVIVAVILGGVFIKRTQVSPSELDKVSVRMKWFFAGTMTGWFSGDKEGVFEKNGIDLTITPGGPDNNSVKLVVAGSDTFGVAGADEVLLARAKGIPVVAIGVLFKESPICFISKKDKGINNPKDWSGKTVEVSYGSNAEVQYRALLAKYEPKDVKEVPYTYSLVPFIENKVDVSVAYKMDQVVTLGRKDIELSIITAKEHGINPYGDVIITTEKTLKENPDLVRRFMSAVVESHQWAIANPEAAVNALVATADNLKADNEQAVWAATIPFLTVEGGVDAVGMMSDQRWKDSFDVMVQYGGLNPTVTIESAYRTVLK